MLRQLKLLVCALALVGVLGVSLDATAQTITNNNFDLTCDTSMLDYDAKYLDYQFDFPPPTHQDTYKISSDGLYVVYPADKDGDNRLELRSIPALPSAASILLDAPDDLSGFQITPDGQHVVYWVYHSTTETHELRSISIDGTEPYISLHTFQENEDNSLYNYAFSSDSQWIVWQQVAFNGSALLPGLFSIRIDGSGGPNTLFTTSVDNYSAYKISTSSTHLVFTNYTRTNLYSVPLDGSTPATSVYAANQIGAFQVTDNWIVFASHDNGRKLFKVPIAGGTLNEIGDLMLKYNFELSPDLTQVLYRPQNDALEIAPVNVDTDPVRLYSGDYWVNDKLITPDNDTVIYSLIDTLFTGTTEGGAGELYTIPSDASEPPTLIWDADPNDSDEYSITDIYLSPDGAYLLYRVIITDTFESQIFAVDLATMSIYSLFNGLEVPEEIRESVLQFTSDSRYIYAQAAVSVSGNPFGDREVYITPATGVDGHQQLTSLNGNGQIKGVYTLPDTLNAIVTVYYEDVPNPDVDILIIECSEYGPRPVYAATNLAHSGDTSTTPSDLTFTWTHNTADATVDNVPARQYQLTVSDGTNTLHDDTYAVNAVCTDDVCAATVTLDFISGGEHTYTITGLNPNDIATSATSTFNVDLPTAPTLTNPGDQTATEGDTISLQLTASDPDMGDTLTWAASGLPAGLSIDQNGLISGTADTAGEYTVTITVTDSTQLSDDAAFTWTINEPGALVGDPGRVYPAHEQAIESASDWPRFTFEPKDGASWYNVWIGNNTTTAMFAWYEASQICALDDGPCMVPDDLWLSNGDYSWWMSYWGETLPDYTTYWNETTFSVDVAVPSLPVNLGVADTSAANPQFTWDSSSNGLWYHVILAPADFAWVYDMGWHTADALSCADGCDYTDPALDGLLPAGDYLLYVAAWGPGGMSIGGIANSGYTEGAFIYTP